MQITFYNFSKRSNSTKSITSEPGVTLNVLLKDGTSIYNPSFTVTNYNFNFNYLKWDNRYYFVIDVTLERANVYRVDCSIDVLATYKQNILDTNAFIEYSTSDYNKDIIDNRLTMRKNAEYHITSAQILSNGSERGTYIVNYVTDNATYGATGLLWTNDTGVRMLSEALTSTDFFNLENFEKQFSNVYQSLLGCKFVPFDWWGAYFPSGLRNFKLGSYNTTVAGCPVRNKIEYSTNIAIPWQFDDYRNLQPYTAFMLFLPGYGLIDINPADIAGKSALTIKLTVDGATGEGTYIIDKFFKGSCNFAVSVPIGTVTANIAGVAGNSLQTATAAISGNLVGAIGGGINTAITSLQRNLGNIGSLGSISALYATIGSDWRNAIMVAVTHNTTVDPDNITAVSGRPLQAVKRIGDLTGYVQTSNASVTVNNNDISEQINTLLNGGVYIE